MVSSSYPFSLLLPRKPCEAQLVMTLITWSLEEIQSNSANQHITRQSTVDKYSLHSKI